MAGFLLIFLFTAVSSGSASLIVETKCGKIIGSQYKSRSGHEYFTFTGIPYAQPPIGELRFKAPVAPNNWDGVKDGGQLSSPLCPQIDNIHPDKIVIGQEDCLYINVYTHNINNEVRQPVLFYVHSGGFYEGHPGPVSEASFMMDEDIVLVTFTYRLGPFGFLSTEDEVIPGNFGLKDQAMALNWVKENIANFGGDPSLITVFGTSAGSASAHYLMLSPLTKDLVSRGISSSGTALAPWAISEPDEVKNYSHKIAHLLGCPSEPHQEMLNCLLSKNYTDIIATRISLKVVSFDIKPHLLPVIEVNSPDAFLTTHPSKLKSSAPWISGITSNEGAFIGAVMRATGDQEIKSFEHNLHEQLPEILMYKTKSKEPEKITNQVLEHYYRNTSIFNGTVKAFGAYYFVWPMIKAAMLHDGPVFLYYYDHIGHQSLANLLTEENVDDLGVGHFDEYYVLFNRTIPRGQPMRESDISVSKHFIKLLVNFVKYGDPSPTSEGVKWDESEKSQKCLRIKYNDFKMIPLNSELKMDYNFWECLSEVHQCKVLETS